MTPLAPSERAPSGHRRIVATVTLSAILLFVAVGYIVWWKGEPVSRPAPRTLSRLTFDEGLQAEPTWSPEDRFIAYSADKRGNFDIWVQPLGGGRDVQVTSSPDHDWPPAWSPDGNSLAFRSEREGGGIFVVPALGGRERKLASFGYWPQWSPDGSKILFVIRGPADHDSEYVCVEF